MYQSGSRRVTAGERLARRFHDRGLDAGALRAEMFETRGQGRALALRRDTPRLLPSLAPSFSAPGNPNATTR